MHPTVLHLLDLIQDCENGDEARLMLLTCGYALSEDGTVRGLGDSVVFFPLSWMVVYGPNIRRRYVYYGDIKRILKVARRRS